MRTKSTKTNGSNLKLKPNEQVKIKGVPALVLQVIKDKVVVQFDRGNKITVPITECRKFRGRPFKLGRDETLQVTCVLNRRTVERLREGAGGAERHFGEFLQEHLDRFPPPTRQEYLSLKLGSSMPKRGSRRSKILVATSRHHSEKDKKLTKEAARRAALTPEQRAWDDSLKETITKSVQKHAYDQ